MPFDGLMLVSLPIKKPKEGKRTQTTLWEFSGQVKRGSIPLVMSITFTCRIQLIMSTAHQASCSCGYKVDFIVGGTRSRYQEESFFPFLCDGCGFVSVNIQASPPICPGCLSGDISQYGQEPVSKREEQDTFPAVQCWGYKAFKENNKCPKCEKYTLNFSGPTAFFDQPCHRNSTS